MCLTTPCFEAEKYITGRKKYITAWQIYLTGRKNYLTARKNGRKKSIAWISHQMMMQDLDLTHEGLSCEND